MRFDIILWRVGFGVLGFMFLGPPFVFATLWHVGYSELQECPEALRSQGLNDCAYTETSAAWWGGDVYLIVPAILLLAPSLICFWLALKGPGPSKPYPADRRTAAIPPQ